MQSPVRQAGTEIIIFYIFKPFSSEYTLCILFRKTTQCNKYFLFFTISNKNIYSLTGSRSVRLRFWLLAKILGITSGLENKFSSWNRKKLYVNAMRKYYFQCGSEEFDEFLVITSGPGTHFLLSTNKFLLFTVYVNIVLDQIEHNLRPRNRKLLFAVPIRNS